ncbi:hypothetical protein SEA_SKOG_152 [Gordonia phage Skog]|uniref:Uncharacterized protein n=1 Tax=Gordonia phage Skog TaxID=2704033 RepID=A0A6G6XJW4_9CAUD|nr:hypothetical protein KHQ85_gp152 [Gordonia phage Skog]QIG58304.1 hypothetical protein SEA_SKOG_152 [Gordonia phage Skog]
MGEHPAGVRAQRHVEWGLRTPDGTEVWQPEKWLGMPISTEEERQAVEAALTTRLTEMGTADQALGLYAWVCRIVTVTVVTEYPHDYRSFSPPLPEVPPEPEVTPEQPAIDHIDELVNDAIQKYDS